MIHVGRYYLPSPLEVILSRLEPDHAEALRWLSKQTGTIGKRPWPDQLRQETSPPRVALTAQRGIHVPNGWDMALSVGFTRQSPYKDGDLETLEDGTWVLLVRAHEGGDGVGLDSPWNRGLYNCCLRRVPVAVFLPATGSDYRRVGLAFVDNYDDSTKTFLLHGPVTDQSSEQTWGSLDDAARDNLALAPQSAEWFLDDIDESGEDSRTRRIGPIIVRENQQQFRAMLLTAYNETCAMTGYEARVALDAAHILPFLGKPSDTARNGLLLRCDIHRLFDRHLIAVDTSSMTILVSSGLESTRYSELDGKPIREPRDKTLTPSIRHLDLHRERFSRARAV